MAQVPDLSLLRLQEDTDAKQRKAKPPQGGAPYTAPKRPPPPASAGPPPDLPPDNNGRGVGAAFVEWTEAEIEAMISATAQAPSFFQRAVGAKPATAVVWNELLIKTKIAEHLEDLGKVKREIWNGGLGAGPENYQQAKFADVTTAAAGSKADTVLKLYPYVAQLLHYRQVQLTVKEVQAAKARPPRRVGFEPDAEKMLKAWQGQDTVAGSQPTFLPLRIAAPPRMGKSALALLVCSLAKKLGMRVLYSVAPNKKLPIDEMMAKIDKLRWQDQSYKARRIDDLPLSDTVCDCSLDEFDICFYSCEVVTDAYKIAALLDNWANKKISILHIHDEAQYLARADGKKRGKSASDASGLLCQEGAVPPPLLMWMRRYYGNPHGIVLNVTATHLPTLQEEAMWGFMGSAYQMRRLTTKAPPFTVADTRSVAGDVPLLMPALSPEDSATYLGSEVLEAWKYGGGPQYLTQGMKNSPQVGSTDNSLVTEDLDRIKRHFREWFEGDAQRAAGQEFFDDVVSVGAADGRVRRMVGTYIGTLNRAVKTAQGSIAWIAELATIPHASYVQQLRDGGASWATRPKNNATSFAGRAAAKKAAGIYGVGFIIVASKAEEQTFQQNTPMNSGSIAERGAVQLNLGTKLAASQERVTLVVYDPSAHQSVMTEDRPAFDVVMLDTVQSAISYAREVYGIDAIAMLGYTMFTAGLTVQAQLHVKTPPGEPDEVWYYCPRYFAMASSKEQARDAQLQLIGRAFVELRTVLPSNPDDWRVQVLGVEKLVEDMQAYDAIEKLWAQQGNLPMHECIIAVQQAVQRRYGQRAFDMLMGVRGGSMGSLLGLDIKDTDPFQSSSAQNHAARWWPFRALFNAPAEPAPEAELLVPGAPPAPPEADTGPRASRSRGPPPAVVVLDPAVALDVQMPSLGLPDDEFGEALEGIAAQTLVASAAESGLVIAGNPSGLLRTLPGQWAGRRPFWMAWQAQAPSRRRLGGGSWNSAFLVEGADLPDAAAELMGLAPKPGALIARVGELNPKEPTSVSDVAQEIITTCYAERVGIGPRLLAYFLYTDRALQNIDAASDAGRNDPRGTPPPPIAKQANLLANATFTCAVSEAWEGDCERLVERIVAGSGPSAAQFAQEAVALFVRAANDGFWHTDLKRANMLHRGSGSGRLELCYTDFDAYFCRIAPPSMRTPKKTRCCTVAAAATFLGEVRCKEGRAAWEVLRGPMLNALNSALNVDVLTIDPYDWCFFLREASEVWPMLQVGQKRRNYAASHSASDLTEKEKELGERFANQLQNYLIDPLGGSECLQYQDGTPLFWQVVRFAMRP
jgi:hypothetical protein